jgi:hypothetical protein
MILSTHRYESGNIYMLVVLREAISFCDCSFDGNCQYDSWQCKCVQRDGKTHSLFDQTYYTPPDKYLC